MPIAVKPNGVTVYKDGKPVSVGMLDTGGGSGGGGVSKQYVDDQDAKTLQAAKTYADNTKTVVDTTLSKAGQAADASKTGQEINLLRDSKADLVDGKVPASQLPAGIGGDGKSVIYGDLVDPAAASDSRATINSLITNQTRFMFEVKNATAIKAGDIVVVPGQYNDAPRVHYIMYCNVAKVTGQKLEVYAKQVIEDGAPGPAGKDAVVDATLSKAGQAADAAETGKRLTALDTKIGGIDKLVGGGI